MGRKKAEYRIEHCECCGSRVESRWCDPQQDRRYLVYTTLGPKKLCWKCHLEFQKNDKLPEVRINRKKKVRY